MGVDELSVLAMVLHTGADTTPHCFIRSGVVAIVAGTGRREIDVASMFRVLGGEYVVECGKLVVVGIPRFRITTVEVFCKFQHIVGVAALRTVNVVDEIHTSILGREMLTTAVPAKCKAALARYDIPEE